MAEITPIWTQTGQLLTGHRQHVYKFRNKGRFHFEQLNTYAVQKRLYFWFYIEISGSHHLLTLLLKGVSGGCKFALSGQKQEELQLDTYAIFLNAKTKVGSVLIGLRLDLIKTDIAFCSILK